jgi:hypothetical protein
MLLPRRGKIFVEKHFQTKFKNPCRGLIISFNLSTKFGILFIPYRDNKFCVFSPTNIQHLRCCINSFPHNIQEYKIILLLNALTS